MDRHTRDLIEALRQDVVSGATAILSRALSVLGRVAVSEPGQLVAVARALREAQPAMAGLRTLAHVLERSSDAPRDLQHFANRVSRSPATIARHTVSLLELRPSTHSIPDSVRLVTVSRSAAVEAAILELAKRRPVVVCCAESRPALEGRALAARLVSAGIATELYTDAGISSAVERAEAVLVGADAIGPESFINKVGTGAVSAAGHAAGVPVYVLAGREKVLPPSAFDALTLNGGPPPEVWPEAPTGLRLENPYFERVRLAWVAGVVTDGGVVPPLEAGSASLWA